MRQVILAITAVVSTGTASADQQSGLRFTGCPIYRNSDSGAKTGCWLVDDPATGIRYDVTASPSKPDWSNAVLVEGVRANDVADACGGVMLDPIRVSVLRDRPCTRFMLEAEGYTGRKFKLPRRNVRPLYEERTKATAPFAAKTFVIPFDFGSSFVTYQLTDYYVDATINYALDVQPARITVTGFAASAPVTVSGKVLVEPVTLAKQRADLIAKALQLRGIPATSIKVAASRANAAIEDEAFDHLPGPSLRRVEVRIEPQPSHLPAAG